MQTKTIGQCILSRYLVPCVIVASLTLTPAALLAQGRSGSSGGIGGSSGSSLGTGRTSGGLGLRGSNTLSSSGLGLGTGGSGGGLGTGASGGLGTGTATGGLGTGTTNSLGTSTTSGLGTGRLGNLGSRTGSQAGNLPGTSLNNTDPTISTSPLSGSRALPLGGSGLNLGTGSSGGGSTTGGTGETDNSGQAGDLGRTGTEGQLTGSGAQESQRPAVGIRIGRDPQGRILVNEVVPGSRAAEAGVQVGDEILAVDGTPIQATEQVVNLLQSGRIGDPYTLQVRRDGQAQTISGQLGSFTSYFGQSDIAGGSERPALGIRVRENANQQLEVTQVEPNSPAEAAGLRSGDVIAGAGGQPVRNFNEFVTSLERARVGNPITLQIQRQNQRLNLTPTVTTYAAMFAPTAPGGTERQVMRQPLDQQQAPAPNMPDNRQTGQP